MLSDNCTEAILTLIQFSKEGPLSTMTIISPSFDLNKVEWRHITDPDCKEFNVDFEYSLLGYNIPNGRLDMLLRYGNLGHCRRHRHVASTMTMVLEGEQHLAEWQPDGSKNPFIVKRVTMRLQVRMRCRTMNGVGSRVVQFFYLCMRPMVF